MRAVARARPSSTSLPPSLGIQAALATARVAIQAESSPAPRPSTPPPAAANGAAASHTRVPTGPSATAAAVTASSSPRSPSITTVLAPSAAQAAATWPAPPAVATTMPSSTRRAAWSRDHTRGYPAMHGPGRPSQAREPATARRQRGRGRHRDPDAHGRDADSAALFQRPSGPLATARGLGLLTPKSRWTWVPVPCFLVEHPTVGSFLIDTGLPPAAPTTCAPPSDGARRSSTTSAWRTGGRSPISSSGWASTRWDRPRRADPHAPGPCRRGRALPRATFVVDAREWQGASDSGFLHGYRRALYDHDYDWRALDFGAEQVSSFASFGHVIDLFADGSVRLLSTPGHTKGHMSVLLRLQSGRELLLTGDAAYSRATIDEGLVPLFCDDVHRYMRSLREIRATSSSPPAPS